MIESFKMLAWSCRPKPPLGVPPWLRSKRWFRWYVIHTILNLVWRLRPGGNAERVASKIGVGEFTAKT